MDTNLNMQVLAANRKPISIIGSTLGTAFFQSEARTCDSNFDKKKLLVEQSGNVDMILNRAPRRYRMTDHDIVSVKYDTDAVGSPKVILNEGFDCEVSLPITADLSSVGIVTSDALKKALSGDKSVIFSNAKKLANQLNQLNRDELTRLDNVITDLQKARQSIVQAIQDNDKKANKYEQEILDSTPKGFVADGPVVLAPETQVNVHIEED